MPVELHLAYVLHRESVRRQCGSNLLCICDQSTEAHCLAVLFTPQPHHTTTGIVQACVRLSTAPAAIEGRHV